MTSDRLFGTKADQVMVDEIADMQTAVCGFLAALWYKTGESGTTSMCAETASKALRKAGSYYRLADELEEKE